MRTLKNDSGPDGGNRSEQGLYVLSAPGLEPATHRPQHLFQVTPTLLKLLSQPVRADMLRPFM